MAACRGGSSRRWPGPWSGNASSGGVRPVGSLFSPLDQRLQLGTEGYSPSLLRKIVRQASKASSFREAAEDLQELAQVTISPTHVRRLCERIGREWASRQDQEVHAYQERQLPRGNWRS